MSVPVTPPAAVPFRRVAVVDEERAAQSRPNRCRRRWSRQLKRSGRPKEPVRPGDDVERLHRAGGVGDRDVAFAQARSGWSPALAALTEMVMPSRLEPTRAAAPVPLAVSASPGLACVPQNQCRVGGQRRSCEHARQRRRHKKSFHDVTLSLSPSAGVDARRFLKTLLYNWSLRCNALTIRLSNSDPDKSIYNTDSPVCPRR